MTSPTRDPHDTAASGSGLVRGNDPRSTGHERCVSRECGFRPVLLFIILLWTAWGAPTKVAAQVEVEADPFAYALDGFSLHVARVIGSYRISLGTFGIDVPGFFHGDDDWSVVMRGAGIKWDLLGNRPDGLFVGFDASYMRMTYTLERTAETEKRHELNVGVRTGYRWSIGGSGFYLTAWVGIGVSSGDDVTASGRTFEHRAINVFPTLHIGWRF